MNRRKFLKLGSLTGPAWLFAPKVAEARVDFAIPNDPNSTYLSERDRQILSSLGEYILPGAGALGAARYIEQFLTAFDYSPPRIHSLRPNDDGFIPLNRVQERAWRLYLFGSKACGGGPNDAISGPTPGLRGQIQDVLSTVTPAFAKESFPFSSLAALNAWALLSIELQQVLTDLVVQSTLANPEYGGNLNGGGWKMISFEGASIPKGYSQYDPATGKYLEQPDHPLSTPNPGPDPHPIGWLTRFFLKIKAM